VLSSRCARGSTPRSALARQHHAIADRQQHGFDARVVTNPGVEGADRIGIGVVMIRIGDTA